MRLRVALYIVGVVNIALALAMAVPVLVSIFYKGDDTAALLYSMGVTAASGLFLFFAFRTTDVQVNHREGFLVVALSWISAAFFCSLPFVFSGLFPSLVDCFFEGTSGITTTGASILSDIEALPHGLLFWRSMTHWIGGMGIVVLSLAVLPLLGIGGMQLYKAEASTISGDKFVPRIREMARILFTVYLVFSFVMLVLLILSGLGIFDALIHTLGGISTAGFSNRNSSVGALGNPYAEVVIMVFMVLGATNFALHYGFIKKGLKSYTESEEFKFYILVMVVATVLLSASLLSYYESPGEALRYGSFQAISISTTTGFTTADYGNWPFFSQLLLLTLMFIGGSAGSTTGSIKCVRVLLLIKLAHKEIYKLIHPHAVVPVKLGGSVVPQDIIRSVAGFTVLFLLAFMASALALGLLGLDPLTAIGSAAATIGNVGPALGLTGPGASYAEVPDAGKWILIINMFLGRLEIYTLLILLIPAFWRG